MGIYKQKLCTSSEVRFLNLHHPEALQYSHLLCLREANEELHCLKQDGEIIKGLEAYLHLWSLIPNYQKVAKITGFKPVYYLAKLVYEVGRRLRVNLLRRR